jgi:hypothetical protein
VWWRHAIHEQYVCRGAASQRVQYVRNAYRGIHNVSCRRMSACVGPRSRKPNGFYPLYRKSISTAHYDSSAIETAA